MRLTPVVPLDLRRGSVIDSSGLVDSFDYTNLINIEGSLVNVDGTLRANGLAGTSSRGGAIRLVATGQSDLQELKDNLQTATSNSPGDASAPTLSAQERTFILQRDSAQISTHDGDVVINRDTQNASPTYMGQLSANGSAQQSDMTHAGDGGTIIITAMHDVVNLGLMTANGSMGNTQDSSLEGSGLAGGDGGTVSLIAQNSILNEQGRIEANGGSGSSSLGGIFEGGIPGQPVDDDTPGHFVPGVVGGHGGNGGLIAFGYHTNMINTGGIYADGGIGGNGSTTDFQRGGR